MDSWLTENPDAGLVIIDILEKVRPARRRNGSVYADDYGATDPLRPLAHKHRVAFLIVHHLNQGENEDPMMLISGSEGLVAAPDTAWVLKGSRAEKTAELHVYGRDVDAQEKALLRDYETGTWTLLEGEAYEHRQSEERQAILNAVRRLGKVTPAQVADELSKDRSTVRTLMRKMRAQGLLQQTKKAGPYEAVDTVDSVDSMDPLLSTESTVSTVGDELPCDCGGHFEPIPAGGYHCTSCGQVVGYPSDA